MDNAKLYTQAEIAYGRKHQMVKAVEELAELQQAITKIVLAEKPTKKMFENFTEEIADVEIMVEQIKRLYECDNEVLVKKKQKLNRLKLIVEDKLNWGDKRKILQDLSFTKA